MSIQEHCTIIEKNANTRRDLSPTKTGRPNRLNRRDERMIVEVVLCNSQLTDRQEKEDLTVWFQLINYAIF